ncbi:MAG: hypothetical protein IJB79_05465 [Candidatus Gastranaerophilales bacterium]|nr:hypothetical protein [Candidatus Gastranaerophilales bacterium]
MNLTINPIKFNNHNFALTKNQNKEQKNYAKIDLANLDASLALKNQILFKNISKIQKRRELIQTTIKENSLPIKAQTLDFVLTPPKEKEGLYLKYSKTGSKFFELFSRYTLHQDYPIKDEGELTDAIVYFIKDNNKTKIINSFIPSDLLPKLDNKKQTQEAQASCLNAFLGALIYENEDGFKIAFNFLNDAIGKNIYPKNLKLEKSSFEKLAEAIEEKGYSWQDIYQETRFFNEQWHYRIHYKDIILSQAQGDRRNHEVREECIKEAIKKIKSGEINLENAGNNLIYTNYKKPSPKRTQELNDFCKQWNLNFDDITLLHKAFLYGEMQDGSALAHCDTYETLEYVGDAVLGFCVHEIIQKNLIDAPRQVISAKRHAFVKNKNLAKLAEKMNLANYTINRDKARGEKRTADMFEALMGAIFLDGKEEGINNVYKFLNEHFKDEICNVKY